jgi:Skp family chaperone for outer membrane proteins
MNLKHLLLPVACTFPLLAAIWVGSGKDAQAQGGPTGVRAVDIDAVSASSPQAKSIMADFEKFQKSKQSELQKEQTDLQKEQQRLGPNSSKDELAAYGNKVQAISRKLQEAELEAQKRYQASRDQIVKTLRPALEGFARDNSVGLIVDSKSGAVLYVDPAWDRTKDVISRLKK